MTDKFLWNNKAITTLSGAHNNTTTTINLNPGDGALFPSPSAGEHFAVTIQASDGTAEVCYCTSRSVDALTVTRGQEASLGAPVAQTYAGGEAVELRVTAGTLNEFSQTTVAETISGDKTFTGNNTFTKLVKWTKGADIASGSALPTPTDGNYNDVTGVLPITSIDTSGVIGTVIKRHFDDVLVLTHHATNLILPGGRNITTYAGYEAEFIEYATGGWRMLTSIAGGPPTLQVFTSSGTWTKPEGLVSVKVTVIGGGGAGGGSTANFTSGQGGGGGGASIKHILAASLGATEVVTIGAGGVGGTGAGPTGGTSSLGSLLQATGGYGGIQGNGTKASTSGEGGIGTLGDLNFKGGANSSSAGGANSKEGGASFMGGGALGHAGSANYYAGRPGGVYGGGGGGANRDDITNRSGGDGGAGIVFVEEYY